MGMKGEAEMRMLNKRTSAHQFLSSAGKIWTRKQKREAVFSLPSAPWPSLPHPSSLLLRGEEVQSEKHSKHPAGTMFIQRVLLAELLRNSPGKNKKKIKKEREKQREGRNEQLGLFGQKTTFFVCFSSKKKPCQRFPSFQIWRCILNWRQGNKWIFGLFPFPKLNKNHQGLMFLAGIILSLSPLWAREGAGSIRFIFSSKIKEKTIEMVIYRPCSSGAGTEFWLPFALVFIRNRGPQRMLQEAAPHSCKGISECSNSHSKGCLLRHFNKLQ